jgi:hypothetical protein
VLKDGSDGELVDSVPAPTLGRRLGHPSHAGIAVLPERRLNGIASRQEYWGGLAVHLVDLAGGRLVVSLTVIERTLPWHLTKSDYISTREPAANRATVAEPTFLDHAIH